MVRHIQYRIVGFRYTPPEKNTHPGNTNHPITKMPPTRRKPSNPAPRAQQTLAFGPNSNKVTKPSLPPTSKKLSQPAQDELSKAVAVETTTPEPEIEDAATQPEAQILSPRTLAIRKHGASKQVERKDVEQEAGRVPDTQIRKYWKGKEDERIAPRVHQQGLSVNEKVLRHFDLSSQYGVCFLLSASPCISIEGCESFLLMGDTAVHRHSAHEALEEGAGVGVEAAG